MATTEPRSAQDAYLAHYMACQELLRDIQNKIHDLPAPDGEANINWADVGDMARIAEQLREIAQ